VSPYCFGQFWLSFFCALLVHSLALYAASLWLGPVIGGMTGPELMSLELAGVSGGSGSGDGSGGFSGAGDSSLENGTGPETRPVPTPPAVVSTMVPVGEAPVKADPVPETKLAVAATPPAVREIHIASPRTVKRKPVTPPAPAPEPDKPVASDVKPPESTHRPSSASGPAAAVTESATASAAAGSGPQVAPDSGHGPGQGTGTGAGHGTGTGSSGIGKGRGGGGGDGLLSFGIPGGPGVEHMVMPEYPREARRMGREGTVVLKLTLDVEGRVDAVEIVQSSGYGMDEAAREAVLRSRFRPATRGGMPVACRAILPIRFSLR